MSDTRKKLDWIQSLRGIAVMLVVLIHARYYFLDTPNWEMAEQVLRPGAMGVDLFFVISGFIMVHTTRDSDGSAAYAGHFLLKRFARIWPAYAVVTVCWLLVAYEGFAFFHDPANVHKVFLSLAFYPVDVHSPLYFGMVLPLGWTLVFEMYFYLVFAASLLSGRWRWVVLAGWMAFTVLAIPSLKRELTFNVLTDFGFGFGYLNLMTNPIILEFLMGACIAWLYAQSWFQITSKTVCRHLLFLSITLLPWFAYSGLGDFHGPLQWGAAMALMVLGIVLASKTIPVVPPQVLVWLGTISYSLYLTHTTTQALVTRYAERFGAYTHGWTHIFLTTVIAISIAAVAHHYLEGRLSHAVKSALLSLVSRRRQPVSAKAP